MFFNFGIATGLDFVSHPVQVDGLVNTYIKWQHLHNNRFLLQGAEAKLGIFKYNNKRLYYETRVILILSYKIRR